MTAFVRIRKMATPAATRQTTAPAICVLIVTILARYCAVPSAMTAGMKATLLSINANVAKLSALPTFAHGPLNACQTSA